MGISFIIPAAVCDLNLTPTNKGLLNGITFFGKSICQVQVNFNCRIVIKHYLVHKRKCLYCSNLIKKVSREMKHALRYRSSPLIILFNCQVWWSRVSHLDFWVCFYERWLAKTLFFYGTLGDTRGRRIVTLWTVLGSTLCTTISVFAKNFVLFLICRFFTGVWWDATQNKSLLLNLWDVYTVSLDTRQSCTLT